MNILSKKYLTSNISVVLLLPFIFNFVKKILNNEIILINYYLDNKNVFFLLVLNSIFYFYISRLISETFNLESLSLSLVYFFTSFFLFVFFSLTLLKGLDFQLVTGIVLFLWFSFLLIKCSSKLKVIYLLISYLIISVINHRFYFDVRNLGEYVELNTDVPVQWFGMAESIYSYNYFYTFTNNLIDGHGLFLSYIQSLVFKINFFNKEFEFLRLNSNLFLIFTLFLFLDLKINKKNKIIISTLFVSLILNSDWLTYLFVDSLMLEGIVSLIFAIFLVNLNKHLNSNLNLSSVIFFASFSCLFFSKQFISTLTIVIFIYLLFVKRSRNVLITLPIYFLDMIYKRIYNPEIKSFEYLNGFNYSDFILDLFFLRDLELNNIKKIIEQFIIDKPMTLLFIIFFIFNLFNFIKFGKNNFSNSLFFMTILLNIFLVLILFIAWWKDFGIQSSYRYILNTLHLVLISIFYNIDSLEENV